MVGGRSGVEEHIQKEGGCLFHFGFLKAAQSDSLGEKKKKEVWVAADAVTAFRGKCYGANSWTRCIWVLSCA